MTSAAQLESTRVRRRWLLPALLLIGGGVAAIPLFSLKGEDAPTSPALAEVGSAAPRPAPPAAPAATAHPNTPAAATATRPEPVENTPGPDAGTSTAASPARAKRPSEKPVTGPSRAEKDGLGVQNPF